MTCSAFGAFAVWIFAYWGGPVKFGRDFEGVKTLAQDGIEVAYLCHHVIGKVELPECGVAHFGQKWGEEFNVGIAVNRVHVDGDSGGLIVVAGVDEDAGDLWQPDGARRYNAVVA